MRLNQKTLFYSGLLAVFLVLFFLIYMVLFLPNLYVDHIHNRNVEVASDLHFKFLEQRSYKALDPINVQSSMSLVLPKDDDRIDFYSKLSTGEIRFKDEKAVELLRKLKDFLQDPKDKFPIQPEEFNRFGESFLKDLPISLETKSTGVQYEDFYSNEDLNFVKLGQNTILFTARTRGQEANYSMIFLITSEAKNFVITLVPVVNPGVGDILPVVMNSLPMVLVVLFLTVLLASTLFSKTLVDPVMNLVSHTRDLKDRSPTDYYPLKVKGKDELAELAQSLNELQETIQRQYSALEEQTETQTVLLRAGSHQLKTPVAASLLLVEGMMQEVGKYKDVKAHLPQLQQQLRSMQQIITSILDMSRPLPLEHRRVNLRQVVEHNIEKTRSLFEKKKMSLVNDTEELYCDLPEVFDWILSILLENAIVHSPEGESLHIWNEGKKLYLENTGVSLSKEVLSHLYTPFVKGKRSSGHGLGLYLASYYAKAMGWTLEMKNQGSGVRVSMDFSKNSSLLHTGSTGTS